MINISQLSQMMNMWNQNPMQVAQMMLSQGMITSQQFNQFKTLAAQNTSPRETVQKLLNSGQMTQQGFNNISQLANMLTGRF